MKYALDICLFLSERRPKPSPSHKFAWLEADLSEFGMSPFRYKSLYLYLQRVLFLPLVW